MVASKRRPTVTIKSVKLVIRRGFAHALARDEFLFVSSIYLSPSSSLLLLLVFFRIHEFVPCRRDEENDFRAVHRDPRTVTILSELNLTL